jgi:hypothetical protein
MTNAPPADGFCPSPPSDPYWNESAWFSFSIPERRLHGFIYYFFRPNMKLLIGGPAMWDPSGAFSWNCLYFDWHHIQAMPAGAEKFRFTADNSLSVEVVEPLTTYRLGYDANGFALNLEWTAISEPHDFPGIEVRAGGESPINRLHIEQCGRMRGQIEHQGQTLDVDCFSMRDTSFGHRSFDAMATGSYFWAIASPDSAFHAVTVGEGDEQRVVGGFLMRDGEMATLADGTRRVTQRGPYTVEAFAFEATDELGRSLAVTARSSSDLLFWGFPRCGIVWSLLAVELDGTTAWGDMQEFAPLEPFRRRMRAAGGAHDSG